MTTKSLITFSISPADNLIRIEIPQDASLSDLEQFKLDIFLNPSLQMSYNILIVISHNKIQRDVFDVLGLVKYVVKLSGFCRNSKWAVVVQDKASEIAFEMMSSFISSENVDLRIFNSEDDGELWILEDKVTFNENEKLILNTLN